MKTFCLLPWIHFSTHPNGKVTLCCISDHNNLMSSSKNFNSDGSRTMLTLNDNSIYEIINSDYFKQVRLQFLNNEIPEACRRCFVEEKNGVESKRVSTRNIFNNFNYEMTKELTSIDGTIKPNLKFLELRVGNKCNYKCRTCNAFSSSYWLSDYNKLTDTFDYIPKFNEEHKNFSWPMNNNFWKDLFQYKDDLEQIYINGGEPTIIKEHWWYLNQLIEKDKNDVVLHYNINASIIPDQALSIWKKFKKIEVDCSVDDIGNRNDYIRSGSRWLTINKNIDKLLEAGIDVSICQTISFMNYFYLDEFIEWLETKGLHNKLHHNIVHYPDFLSPSILPLKLRDIIHKKFEQSKYRRKLRNFKNVFSSVDEPDKFKKAMEYTKMLDELRHESFKHTFPELMNYLNKG